MEEIAKWEEFKREENKKLQREKKLFEKHAATVRARPDKQERDEIQVWFNYRLLKKYNLDTILFVIIMNCLMCFKFGLWFMSVSGSKAAIKRAARGSAQTRGSLEQHTEPSSAAGRRFECRERVPQRPSADTGETASQCVEEC